MSRHHLCFIQGYPRSLAASFSTGAGACVIDQYMSHHLRRHGKEVGAILPVHILLVYQPHIGFIDQGCRLQRVAGAFATHVVMGQTPEFVIDQRRELVQCRLVSVAPRFQQAGDFVWRRWHLVKTSIDFKNYSLAGWLDCSTAIVQNDRKVTWRKKILARMTSFDGHCRLSS